MVVQKTFYSESDNSDNKTMAGMDRGLRVIGHVPVFKKFLVEIDKLPPAQQLVRVREIMASAMKISAEQIPATITPIYKDVMWQIDNGQTIPINRMVDSHLQAAISSATSGWRRRAGDNHWSERCVDSALIVVVGMMTWEILANRKVALTDERSAYAQALSAVGGSLVALSAPRPAVRPGSDSRSPTRHKRDIE